MGCIYFKTVLTDFVSKQVVMQNIFPLLFKALLSRINSYYSILFSNLKQKEHNFISSRVINSLMGLMFLETPYIYIYIYIWGYAEKFILWNMTKWGLFFLT